MPANIEPTCKTIEDLLHLPWSKLFWIVRTAGVYRTGDAESHFHDKQDVEHLTFDIANNTMLANVEAQGVLQQLTNFHTTYRTGGNLTGVWLAKDRVTDGPYAYTLEVEGESYDLATVAWDLRSGLLDNIFPITELYDPQQRFIVRLLTVAPLSADGAQRLPGVIYGLSLENLTSEMLTGIVYRPKRFGPWRSLDFEIGLADTPASQESVEFKLAPGESLWVPSIIYAPGQAVLETINARGATAWLLDSWSYYRRLLGRLDISDDGYLADFYERQVMQALQSLAMSDSETVCGANWGSFPATQEIWIKDMYYAALPLMGLDPLLAQKLILWFTEYEIHHAGTRVAGGFSHAISLTVASLLLAAHYYDQTGDDTFFHAHPELLPIWAERLSEVLATREEDHVWLFPTRYISDGALGCDYHTGSNVCIWRALTGFARLLAEVYGDEESAPEFAKTAHDVRAALLKKTIINGPFGQQFIEGTFRDGRPPQMISDGEESDTTLMPFYGFLPYDDVTYRNYMHYAMTPENLLYQPKMHAITWFEDITTPLEKRIPSTAPGYMKGLCYGTDHESLFGKHGYYTEVRRVTDADGSLWWWVYGLDSARAYGEVGRFLGGPGKSAWFSGVYVVVFLSRYLGLSYDAPSSTLRFAPLTITGDFVWKDFPLGNARFSIRISRCEATVIVQCANLNEHPLHLQAILPVADETCTVSVNGQVVEASPVQYLDQHCLQVDIDIDGGGEKVICLE